MDARPRFSASAIKPVLRLRWFDAKTAEGRLLMKKFILLMLTLTLCFCTAVALVACCGPQDVEATDGDGSSNEPDYGTATVMGKWNKISIFVPDSKATDHSEPLKEALEKWTGKKVDFLNGYAYPTDHDIVIGYFEDREISVKAYSLLERMEKDSYFDGRYLIYADSGEICIAYDENKVSNLSALDFALEYFIENLVEGKEYIAYARGVIYSENIDLIAEQETLDIATTAAAWDRLAEVASPEIISALQKYYSLYTDSLIDWLANLYAPGYMNLETGEWAGGFYGAPSGRDTTGFGPDITCTRQVLGLMKSTGALDNLDGDYGQNLPDKMRREIIYMLKTLQDPTDGFFYHPQYDKETMSSIGDLQRRGRDLSAAIELFSNLGASPTHDTPTGGKGDGVTADEYLGYELGTSLVKGNLTSNLGNTASGAISALLPSDVTLTSSITDNMFESHDGFAAYLETVKINEESYVWGNTLNAISSQIRSASSKLGKCTDASSPWYGKTLVDMLIEFLDERINPVTGMWEGVTTFRATNGFYKIISVYNACKRSFAMPQLAAEGLIAGLLGDQVSKGNICDVYNIWIGLSDLRSNVQLYSNLPKDERDAVIDYIDSALMRDGAAAILNSYTKYLPYRYDDGSFSDNVGAAADTHNGLPVGLGLAEGDTNATSIAVGVVSRIYACYGWTEYKVPLYTESDWMRFIDIILRLQPVIKYSYLSDDIEQNFDSLKDGELESVDNISYSTGGVSKATVKTEGDNSYIEFNKFAVDNSGRVVVAGNRAMSNAKTAVIEFKMNVIESNNGRISISIGKYNRDATMHTIYFGKSSDGKVNYDSVAGWANTGISLGEWFNVKIVYFEGNDELPLEFRVYINGTLMDIRYATSKNVRAKDVGAVTLVPLYAWKGTVLYDDVKIVRNNEQPNAGEKPLYTPIVLPEYDYAVEDGVHTFDKQADGVIPSGCVEDFIAWSDGEVSEAMIVSDGENKYFYFNKTATNNSGSAKFKFADATGAANVVTVTLRMFIESGNNGLIGMNILNKGGDGLKRVCFYIEGKSIMYGADKTKGLNTGAVTGEWIDLKIVYYEGAGDGSIYLGTYVNDKLVAVEKTVDKNVITAENINTFSFVPLYGFTGKIRLDDIALTRTEESYKIDELPSPEVIAPPVQPEPDEPEPDEPDEPSYRYETENGVHTFDKVEAGEIPDSTSEKYIKFSSGGVVNAHIVTEGDGKILQFNKTNKDASGSVSFMFDKPGEVTAFKASFDVKIAAGSNSGNVGFNFLTASTSNYLSRVFFKVSGRQIQVSIKGEWTDVIGVAADDWFTVDVIYYDGGDLADNAYLEIYVNGYCYGKIENLDNYHKVNDICRIQLIPLYAFIGTVYVDNVAIEYYESTIPQIESPAEPPKPLPSFKLEDGVHTFENAALGEISSGYSDSYITYSSGNVSTAAIVTEGENKVLEFVKTDKTTSGSVGYLFPAVEAGSASYFKASFDMKVKSGASSGEIAFTLSDASTSKYLLRPLLRAEGRQIQAQVNGEWTNVQNLTVDQWFKVDVIYFEGASDEDRTGAYLSLYINGTLCYTTETFSNSHTAENIRRIVLVPLMKFTGTVYMDNVSLTHSAEEPEAPVAPTEPEKPVIPEAGDDADVSFDQMPETGVVSITVNNVAEYQLVESVADKDGVTKQGVLHVNKTASGDNASVAFGLTANAENAEKLVFTADYKSGSTGTGGIEFYASGKFLFEKSGFATTDKWSKLTLILTQNGADVIAELYVDGELVASGSIAGIELSSVSKLNFRWWKNSVAEMYLDNVSFRAIPPKSGETA